MTNSDSRITVIGLGSMGAAIAGAFVRADRPITVWNRSAAKAEPLVTAGADLASDVRAAVEASPVLIACVLDDSALHAILDPVAESLSGRVMINLTSGTPEEARATAAWATGRGGEYLDGKILAFPSTIGTPEAFLLLSGDANVNAVHGPVLETLGSTSFLGTDAGLAALYDLGLLGIMYGTMTGFLHALAVLDADGVDAPTFLPHAKNLAAALPGYLAAITDQVASGDFANGGAGLDMQAAYLQHMVDVSAARGVDAAFPDYVKGLMDRAIDAGHARDDVAALVDQLRTPEPVT